MSALTPPFRLLLDIPAWQRETAAMSAAAGGALLLLKMHLWVSGPIPDNDRALSRITGMDSKEWKQTRKTLEPLFTVMHGEWQRIDWNDELEAAYEAVNKASKKSQKMHAARWKRDAASNAPSNAPSTAPRMLNIKGTSKAQTPKAPSQGNDGFRHGDDEVPAEWLKDLKSAEDAWIENNSALAGVAGHGAATKYTGGSHG